MERHMQMVPGRCQFAAAATAARAAATKTARSKDGSLPILPLAPTRYVALPDPIDAHWLNPKPSQLPRHRTRVVRPAPGVGARRLPHQRHSGGIMRFVLLSLHGCCGVWGAREGLRPATKAKQVRVAVGRTRALEAGRTSLVAQSMSYCLISAARMPFQIISNAVQLSVLSA